LALGITAQADENKRNMERKRNMGIYLCCGWAWSIFQTMYFIVRGGGGAVGNGVGAIVGVTVGVGATVGDFVGAPLGAVVGTFVGATVGTQRRPRFVQDWVGVTPFF
jgi:hypothetical protein